MSCLEKGVTFARGSAVGLIVAIILSAAVDASHAATYVVGPGEQARSVSEVAGRLEPGDVVEITGDIGGAFRLARHGTKERPITIRGRTRVENGVILRPRIRLSDQAIVCRGDWNILEGLDISGAKAAQKDIGTAVWQFCDNLVIRNCRIHHNGQAVAASPSEAGSILVEFCEFDSSGSRKSPIAFYTTRPGAKAVVQYCYFHDSTGGSSFQSRCSRNVIRYNWFENPYLDALRITDSDDLPKDPPAAASAYYPTHTDVVGNVFLQGWSPGPRWPLLVLGGDGPEKPGTEGDFSLAHNLFILTCNSPRDPAPALRVQGNVDRIRCYNNAVLLQGVGSGSLYSRGDTWDTARTAAFRKRPGDSEPIVEGSNNWVSEKAGGVPVALRDTLRGLNPKFVDLLNGDYRPRQDSPLASAGVWPLPKGRIVDLIPEYEPQRGIPSDLKPKPRRKVTPPSIGPFEVPEESQKSR